MAIKTYTEQLEEVQAAITDILTNGESASFQGRSVGFSNLEALQKREMYLISMVKKESRGGIRVRGVTPVNS